MSHLGLGMKKESRPRRRGPGAGLAVLAVLVVVGIIGGAIAALLWLTQGLRGGGDAGYTGEGSGTVAVRVEPGQSAADIGRTLAEQDVVKSASDFVDAARNDDASRGIQPGTYELRSKMGGKEALALILDPKSRLTSRVTIPEGVTVAKTIKLLAAGSPLKVDALTAAAKDTAALGLPASAKGRVEGYLFPATYDVEPGSDPAQVLAAMVTRFGQAADAVSLTEGAAALGITEHDVVTIASLIQAESARPEDDVKVARVIYNRLAKEMPLQLDSTVNYALDRSTLDVSIADTKIDSPFNTYANVGLPPGPIDSPGEVALQAALSPAEGDWLYFVTTDPANKVTEFTADYDEFLRLKAKFEATRG